MTANLFLYLRRELSSLRFGVGGPEWFTVHLPGCHCRACGHCLIRAAYRSTENYLQACENCKWCFHRVSPITWTRLSWAYRYRAAVANLIVYLTMKWIHPTDFSGPKDGEHAAQEPHAGGKAA